MKQIIMRRAAVYNGATLAEGTTYSVEDDVADSFVAQRYAIYGPLYDEASTVVLRAPPRATGNPVVTFWSSAFGAKSIQLWLTALAAGDVVVAAWSPVEADSAALLAQINLICNELESATPAPTSFVNVRVLPAPSVWVPFIWDAVSPIKTFGLVVCRLGAATGGTAQRAIAEIGY